MEQLNAMEELAMACLTVRDLAEELTQGRVLIEAPAFVVPTQEDVEAHKLALQEIRQAQMDLYELGWHRCMDAAVLMPYQKHNIECAAWFKNFPEEDRTAWIRCTIATRFGLRCTFWNVIDPGEVQARFVEPLERSGE